MLYYCYQSKIERSEFMNRGGGPRGGGPRGGSPRGGGPRGHHHGGHHRPPMRMHYNRHHYGRRGYYGHRTVVHLSRVGTLIVAISFMVVFLGVILLMALESFLGVMLVFGGIMGVVVAMLFRDRNYDNQNNLNNQNNFNTSNNMNYSNNQMIKCRYCETQNDNSLTNCCNCGAAL